MDTIIKNILTIVGGNAHIQDWQRICRWATRAVIKYACRSFQVFRCLIIVLDLKMLKKCHRLANTICDDNTDVQGFMQIFDVVQCNDC